MVTTKELAEFWDELSRHDWTYMMSDYHLTWRRGLDNDVRLDRLANELGIVAVEMKAKWHRHVWSGDHMGTEKQPCPERPGGHEDGN